MEAFKNRLKPIALILTALLLFQSCVIYHKTPTTLEQVSQQRIYTKVTTEDNKTFKFQYITYENGTFNGINERNGKVIRTSLYNEKVTGVYEINNAASTLATLATFVGIPIIVTGLVFIALELDL
jgi:hypothetical protein